MNNRIRIVAVALAVLPGLFALSALARKAHHPAAAPPGIAVPAGWVACQDVAGRWMEPGSVCHTDPADRAPDYVNLPAWLSLENAPHLLDVPREPPCPNRRGCA